MPYGRAGGPWVLLDGGQVSLRYTRVDVEDAVSRLVVGSTCPDRQAWADEYARATASDAEAVQVFGPRDGRPV